MGTGPITRGGLVPAKLTNTENTSEIVYCMFNPFEYTIKQANTWEKKKTSGQETPQVHFKQGGLQEITLNLHFDTLAEGASVTKHTQLLWKWMQVTTEKKKSAKSQPPIIEFTWGNLTFSGVITSLTEKFTLFTRAGTPVRSEVSFSLMEGSAVFTEVQGQSSAQRQQVTSVELIKGSTTRPDLFAGIASASASEISKFMRETATANNMDDPLNAKSGQRVTVQN
ncbi:MAG: hypothetical protein JXB47_07215 [Anaerolineae bacterium]|nr:hypothetical protein [Anaerolineae bacterium]